MKEKDELLITARLHEANDEDTDMTCQIDPQLCNNQRQTERYDLFI